MTRSPSIARLAVAMAKAQGAFLTIEKDKEAKIQMKAGGSFGYKFADLASCLASVRAALSENGIAMFQPVEITRGAAGGAVAVATTMLVHGPSGEWISGDYVSAIDNMSDPKSVGSATTYSRRYGMLALLAIAPDDEDDDAEAAAGRQAPKGAANGYEKPSGQRAADPRDAGEAPPFDPGKDPEWKKFLGGCDGVPLDLEPARFVDGFTKKIDAAKTKADLAKYATWLAAGTGMKSPVVRDVVDAMKHAFNARTSALRGTP